MRINKLRLSIFISAVLMASNALAGDGNFRQLKGDELFETLNGKTTLGEYNTRPGEVGLRFTEIHHKDGTSTYDEDNDISYVTTWKIVGGDKLCYNFFDEQGAVEGTYCFIPYIKQGCIYNYHVSNMTLKGPKSWDNWVSKAVIKGSGDSCGEPVS